MRASRPRPRHSGRRRKPTRSGSWPTATTEAESAQRHVEAARDALRRLMRELTHLRAAADTAARLDIARALLSGPDGGPLSLLAGLAASNDSAAAPFARAASLAIERLATTLGLTAIHRPGERVAIPFERRRDYEWLGQAAGDNATVVRPGWSWRRRTLARPVVTAAADAPDASGAYNDVVG